MSHQQPPNTNGKIIIFPSKNTQNLSTENETILHMKELVVTLNQQTLNFATQANKKQPSFWEQLISVKTWPEFLRFVIISFLIYFCVSMSFEFLAKLNYEQLGVILNAAKEHK
jgi:hypothetical protein